MEIVAVNRAERFALTDSGDICPITNLFDAFGDETDDASDAVAAVARIDADHWFTIDLTQFEPVEVH
jgi:hypothetical protein